MTTAFVLTGGGSLGAVQVGMLQALAAHGVEPDFLVGTSAGALNAAWVASHGFSLESLAGLDRVWCGLRRQDVFPLDLRTVARGLRGRSAGIVSPRGLRGVIAQNSAALRRLEDARIPLHVVTTNLLTGQNVTLSQGPLVEAVLASAAIPGVFPPVVVDGLPLVDGGVADETGLARARQLGATTIYLLPTGTPCALAAAPASALGTAVHALSLLIQDRVALDVARHRDTVSIRLLPPLCPVHTSAIDFAHAAALIARARKASAHWIESGDIELPAPERFLATHDHGPIARQRDLPLPRSEALGQ